ncbi:hypothetical protein HDU79_000614 [Rhizoclosmatium sp. JEL0117]|nr:hypothetical protein HDU79_000614 [Rhizoclosmatium sp. JEL0117]
MLQPFDIDTTLAQTGMILFFIGSNGFLVSRIHEYYKDKTEMRKKAAAHAFKIANNKRTQPVHPMGPSAQGPTIDRAQPPPNQNSEIEITVESSVLAEPASLDRVPSISTDAFETLESEKPQQPINSPTQQIFDKQFGYVRRLKHILPQYNKIHITFGNVIQISVIFIEFIQLASFPYRDLLVNQNFQRSLGYDTSTGKSDAVGNEFISWIRSSFSLISAGFPEVSTLVLSNIKFAIAWWISLLGVLVAAGFIGIKGALKEDYAWIKKYPRVKKVLKVLVEGPYIIYFEPLTSIFYLILLGSFIEPLGCLSSNKTPLWPPQVGNTDAESFMLLQNAIKLREEQCAPLLLNPPLQVWFTVIGYLLGYYLLTIFKICDEQKPKDGIVTFTTRSEVLNKNGSLTLLLLYTLIPTSDSTTLRGIIAIFVISFMIFYQVRIGSSYIRPINLDDEDGPLTKMANRLAEGTLQPLQKVRNSFLTVSRNIGLTGFLNVPPPVAEEGQSEGSSVKSDEIGTSSGESASMARKGTLKSMESVTSNVPNNTLPFVANPDNLSRSQSTADRAAAYNSKIRTKLQGPRPLSMSVIDSLGRGAVITCDPIDVRGSKTSNFKKTESGRVSVDSVSSRPISEIGSDVPTNERKPRFEKVGIDNSTVQPKLEEFTSQQNDEQHKGKPVYDDNNPNRDSTFIRITPRSSSLPSPTSRIPPANHVNDIVQNSIDKPESVDVNSDVLTEEKRPSFRPRTSSLPRPPQEVVEVPKPPSEPPNANVHHLRKPIGPRKMKTKPAGDVSESEA